MSVETGYQRPEVHLSALVPIADASGTLSFKVDFSFPASFIDSITFDVLRRAYREYDRRIRIRYTIRLFKVKTIGSKTLREISFSKKWVLYWTRDPNILEKYRTNIWPLGVDKDGYAEFFNDFDEAKKFLFKISETITVTAGEVGVGDSNINASVEAKIWRHTFAQAGTIAAKADPVKISVMVERSTQ